MTRVLAALDNSAAARPVLATALAVGPLFEARVEPIHVRVDGDAIARGVADAAGLPLSEISGPVAEKLLEAASAEDVAVLVVGARGTPGGARPAGRIALAVAAALAKPVVLVPPDAAHPGRLRRVLVPLEGSTSTSLAPLDVIRAASRAALEVVVLHVHDEASLPSFTDQPQHETEAWAREFLARYYAGGLRAVKLEVRVGRCEGHVPRVVEETDADLVALGWARELEAGRAPVVRGALEQARTPVMLIPVTVPAAEEGRR